MGSEWSDGEHNGSIRVRVAVACTGIAALPPSQQHTSFACPVTCVISSSWPRGNSASTCVCTYHVFTCVFVRDRGRGGGSGQQATANGKPATGSGPQAPGREPKAAAAGSRPDLCAVLLHMEAEQLEDIAAAAGHPAGGQRCSLVRDSILQVTDSSSSTLAMGRRGQKSAAISISNTTSMTPLEASGEFVFRPSRS